MIEIVVGKLLYFTSFSIMTCSLDACSSILASKLQSSQTPFVCALETCPPPRETNRRISRPRHSSRPPNVPPARHYRTNASVHLCQSPLVGSRRRREPRDI